MQILHYVQDDSAWGSEGGGFWRNSRMVDDTSFSFLSPSGATPFSRPESWYRHGGPSPGDDVSVDIGGHRNEA
jgi:hypothetical protein